MSYKEISQHVHQRSALLVDAMIKAVDRINESGLNPIALKSECQPDNIFTEAAEREVLSRIHTQSMTEGVGLSVGSSLNFYDLGCFGHALISARTTLDAIELSKRFRCMGLVYIQWEASLEKGQLVHQISPAQAPEHLIIMLTELSFSSFQNFARVALSDSIRPKKLELAYPRPPHWKMYEENFQCPVTFDCASSRLYYAEDWAHRVHKTYDPLVLKAMVDQCETVAAKLASQRDIVGELRSWMRAQPRLCVEMGELASQLCLSERNLRRRLQQCNTSFKQEVDSLRQEKAIHELISTTHSMEHIADKCGFSEPRGFYSAFNRWTGISPAGYRQQHSVPAC